MVVSSNCIGGFVGGVSAFDVSFNFKVDSLFLQSVNFSRFGDKRMGSSMMFDKGQFNYRFGFVDLMMECVSNVRFLISCQTSIRWGVTE